jgi:HlyD family secretion protein
MAEKPKKKSRRWILVVIALAIAGFFGFQWWKASQSAVPKGIAYGNGRIEAKLVDASAKEPLRVKEILVAEGDLVKPGQVLVRLDTSTLESQLAQARAEVAASHERLAVASATIKKTKSQISLATIEADRSKKLVEEHAASQREYDVRSTALETTKATLAEAEAQLSTAKQEVEVAKANVATIETRIADATLVSPVTGRVLYRLAEPGEVLGPGGKALTIVNLQDVYMEIFLPSKDAAALRTGAEARLTVDYLPGRTAAGYVSFVSPEAQFTPKQVETKSEREKLMFRVKIQVPPELVAAHLDRIRTGVRGVGYVKVDERAAWPAWLNTNLLQPGEHLPGEGAAAAAAAPAAGVGAAPAAAETTTPANPAPATPAPTTPATTK